MGNKTKLSRLKHLKQSMISYSMIMPFCIFFFVFLILPIFAAIFLSFTDFNMSNMVHFVGIENYKRLIIDDEVFLTAFKNTIVFAIINGPLGYIIAFALAWIINQIPKGLRVFMTVVFYAPSLSGNIYFIWQYLFSGDAYGLINGMLLRFNLIREPIQWFTDPKYNMAVIIIVQLWMSLGVGFLSFIAGFQGIDKSQYEAGAIDGIRNRFQELWYITLPNMKQMLLFGAVMQIASAFSVGAITETLSGGSMSVEYSTLTILNHISDYGNTRYELGYACAIAVVLFVMVVGTKKLVFKLLSFD